MNDQELDKKINDIIADIAYDVKGAISSSTYMWPSNKELADELVEYNNDIKLLIKQDRELYGIECRIDELLSINEYEIGCAVDIFEFQQDRIASLKLQKNKIIKDL